MKSKIHVYLLAALLAGVHAGAGAGSVAGFGGSTEITQILNNLQLIQSYEQQVSSYVRQGLQVEHELRNLISNPTSMLGSYIGQIINTMGNIMNGGQSIGWNLAQIDRNFSQTFKNPTAGNFSRMFTSWHKTNTDTLEGALKSIGAQRDQYASNQQALTDLYNRSQATSGNLDSLQTLSQINIRQIQQLQSLQELMATQASAEATFMATQNAKDEKARQDYDAMSTKYSRPIPSVETAPAPSWKNFGK